MGSGSNWYVSPRSLFTITQGRFGISVSKGGKVIQSEKYKLSPGYYPTIKSVVSTMFVKVFAGSHFHNYRKLESKFIDFSVDSISQRIFIKTMPDLKLFLDSGDLQHVFGFMPSNEPLGIDNNQSVSPYVHDIQRFHSIIVYTDFIDNTILGDLKAPVLKSFPIEKPHFETAQGLISKSVQNFELRRVLKNSSHSISIDLRSPNGERILFFSTHLSLLFRRMQK